MPRPKSKEPREKHVTVIVSDSEREAINKKAAAQERSVSYIGRKLFLAWLKERT